MEKEYFIRKNNVYVFKRIELYHYKFVLCLLILSLFILLIVISITYSFSNNDGVIFIFFVFCILFTLILFLLIIFIIISFRKFTIDLKKSILIVSNKLSIPIEKVEFIYIKKHSYDTEYTKKFRYFTSRPVGYSIFLKIIDFKISEKEIFRDTNRSIVLRFANELSKLTSIRSINYIE